ncbi:MAG TPA: hypothetical protein VGP37_06235, partial [Candidatus Nanopelagicales bacterium]|nr:hypothetical protein [Candidatus Nanopelagicales bacterium]
LGQGKENARVFLKDNADLSDEIEKRLKESLGIGPRVDAPAQDAPAQEVPVESAAGDLAGADVAPPA